MSLALLWLSSALAAQLTLSVNSRALTVGETVSAELQLVDGAAGDVPAIPVGAGLSLGFQGQSQSRVMVNFKTTRIISYDYAITALREGTWSVGPVSMDVGGQTLTAPAVTVRVAPRSAEARADRDVSAALSDADPYLGQVVVYRFRFEHRGDVLDANWTPPSYDGFVREQQTEVSQREAKKTVDGEAVTVAEIDVPLVAAATGDRAVGPAMLRVQVQGGGRRGRSNDPFAGSPFRSLTDVSNETLTAPAVRARIRPLPDAGRPADYSGLVGSFSLTATPSTRSVKVGETLTLDVVVEGDGTLSGFKLPAPTGEGFRAYDDAPELSATLDADGFRARAHLRRALVPERAGELTIPPLTLSVFNPDKDAYETVATEPITLTVLPGESDGGQVSSFAAAPQAAPGGVASLGKDILPVPGDAAVRDRTLSGALAWLLLPPALPALGLGFLGLSRALGRRRADPWLGLRARLGGLPAEPTARLSALEQLFREAAGLKLGAPAPGLDRAALAPLGERASALYADLERARYGGLTVEDLEPRVRQFIDEVSP